MPTRLCCAASVRVVSSPGVGSCIGRGTRFSSGTKLLLSTSVRKPQHSSISGLGGGSERLVAVPSSSTPAADSMGDSSVPRHAALHDFCMNIPYGAFMVMMGLIACVFVQGAVKFGVVAASVGALEIVLSSMSLKTWKVGGKSAPFTVIGGICSGVLTYVSVGLWRLGAFPWMSGTVGLASGAISIFLLYNVLSGGNPPPKKTADTKND